MELAIGDFLVAAQEWLEFCEGRVGVLGGAEAVACQEASCAGGVGGSQDVVVQGELKCGFDSVGYGDAVWDLVVGPGFVGMAHGVA